MKIVLKIVLVVQLAQSVKSTVFNGFSLFHWPIYGSPSSGSKKSEEKNEQPILSIESNKESEITLINKKNLDKYLLMKKT